MMYIVDQLTDKKEKEKLQQVFKDLDANGDGRLSREELIQGYTKMYNDPVKAQEEVNKLMRDIDTDGNGFIDYSEFLLASVNKQKAVSQEKLKRAFQLFDKDNDGYITPEEVRAILGATQKFSEEVWKEIINEVDENKDGKITFDEFERMMTKFAH